MDNASHTQSIDSSLPLLSELSSHEVKALQTEAANTMGVSTAFNDSYELGGIKQDGIPLVVIPAGLFMMGSNEDEFGHLATEAPMHYVTIRQPFAIGQYTVTSEEFEHFRQDTQWHLDPDLIWHKGKKPVINIRASEARLYLKWLSEKTGQKYRLPTEAEWEYSCRAGTQTPFYFGNEVSCKEIHFNPNFPYNEQKAKKRWFFPKCLPVFTPIDVGLKQPNLWGVHDMHGNVWEITQSPWTSSHINANRDGSASQHVHSADCVTKGGSWFDPAVKTRSAARMRRLNDELDTNLGFRVVREL